jgi:hypothetical protein
MSKVDRFRITVKNHNLQKIPTADQELLLHNGQNKKLVSLSEFQ